MKGRVSRGLGDWGRFGIPVCGRKKGGSVVKVENSEVGEGQESSEGLTVWLTCRRIARHKLKITTKLNAGFQAWKTAQPLRSS